MTFAEPWSELTQPGRREDTGGYRRRRRRHAGRDVVRHGRHLRFPDVPAELSRTIRATMEP